MITKGHLLRVARDGSWVYLNYQADPMRYYITPAAPKGETGKVVRYLVPAPVVEGVKP